MFIQKINKPKDAIRINSEQDIPDFLKDVIKIEDNNIFALSSEGWNETPAPLGTVMGFDRKAFTEFGVGAWPLDKDSYVEKDGVFYPAPEVKEAIPIEGPYSIETKYGHPELGEGERGLLVTTKSGQDILTEGTTNYDDYMVCDEEGRNMFPMSKFTEIRNFVEDSRGKAFQISLPGSADKIGLTPEHSDKELYDLLLVEGASDRNDFDQMTRMQIFIKELDRRANEPQKEQMPTTAAKTMPQKEQIPTMAAKAMPQSKMPTMAANAGKESKMPTSIKTEESYKSPMPASAARTMNPYTAAVKKVIETIMPTTKEIKTGVIEQRPKTSAISETQMAAIKKAVAIEKAKGDSGIIEHKNGNGQR